MIPVNKDCLEFLSTVESNSVDLVLTDPPYFIGFDGGKGWDSQWKSEEDYLHQGIARRSFKRSWTLSDDMIVNDAVMTSGMLIISLERIIPEEKKSRQIPIVTK